MTTKQLVQLIEAEEYILPKSILKDTTEDELANELIEIYHKYHKKLEKEAEFRRKYTELINYMLVLNIRREKDRKKKILFDKNLINYLLSTPEAA